MENNENVTSASNSGSGLIIGEESKEFLMEGAKWAKFMAILGFIGLGFMVLSGLFSGAVFSNIPNSEMMPFSPMAISITYLVIAVLYYFPLKYLYSFANNTKTAVLSGNNQVMQEAFKNLKSHYKFVAIFTIVTIVLTIVGVIVAISMASKMAPPQPSDFGY